MARRIQSPRLSWRERFRPDFHKLNERYGYRRVISTIRRWPIVSFIVALLLLLGLIAAGNYFFKPKTTQQAQPEVIKEVSVVSIGTTPKITYQAQIEKSGVIKIVALAPGVVNQINVSEGSQVIKGTNLIQLAANYSGGNPAAIQTAIASKQYQLASSTLNTQKEIIAKQREAATKSDVNADEMMRISAQSIDDTRANINLIQQNMDKVVTAVDALEALPAPTPEQEAQIQQLRGTQAQLQGALIQARNGLRILEYSTNPSNPPAQLSDIQRDIALKQLDVQEKSLQIGKEVASLQVSLAAVNAEMYHPTAPFAGVVERVFVKVGESVNPGMPLLQLSGSSKSLTAIAKVPGNIAAQVSRVEPTIFEIKGTKIELLPSYVSQEATEGTLYSVIYTFPDGYEQNVTVDSYLPAQIPVGASDTNSAYPFIPLDAVFQTQNESIVYVVEGEVAKARVVTLGEVAGGYVAILSGLNSGDKVVVERNVVEGDKVSVKR